MPDDKKEQLTEEEEFDAAFDEAFDKIIEDTSEEGSGDDDGTETSDGEADKQEGSQEDTSGEDHKEPQKEPKTEPEGTPASSDQNYQELYESAKVEIETLKGEISSLNQKMKSWEGRITKANERAEEAEKKLKDKPSGDKELDDVQEDDESVKNFMEEFPDFKKPIVAIAKKVAKQMIESELKDIKPSIEQVKETVKRSDTEIHFGKIRTAHPDYADIYKSGKLTKWIEEQPSFIQSKLNEVVDNGKAEDIIEMFNLYKDSVSPKDKVTNPGTKDKAKNIMTVKSSSSGPPATTKKDDPDDYDAGWSESKAKDSR